MHTRSLTDEIKIRVEPELRLAIEAEAAADRRPVSSLIRNVLADYAARRAQACVAPPGGRIERWGWRSPMTRRHRKPDWGQLGPAMRALPNDRWRSFVYHLVTDQPGHGALAAAARAAGFGRRSTPETVAKIAWRMSHDERAIAAIAEESRKIIRAGAPEAVNALLNLIRDPNHRDHGRAIALMLERTDPAETRSHHSVEGL